MAWESAVVRGFVGVLFLWAYLSFNIKGGEGDDVSSNFAPIKLLLVLLVFLGIGLALFVIKLIADTNLASVGTLITSAFNIYIIVFGFVVAYYVIMYAMFLIKKMMEKH